MDPDSGLDAVLNVAVRNGVIVALTEETPGAREVIDAGGLVVAPGFIDLHAHGQGPREQPVSGAGRGDDGDGAGRSASIRSPPGMWLGRGGP